MNKTHKITAKEIKGLHKQTFEKINNDPGRFCFLFSAWCGMYCCIVTVILYILSESDIKYEQKSAWGFIAVAVFMVIASMASTYLMYFRGVYKQEHGSSDHISDG